MALLVYLNGDECQNWLKSTAFYGLCSLYVIILQGNFLKLTMQYYLMFTANKCLNQEHLIYQSIYLPKNIICRMLILQFSPCLSVRSSGNISKSVHYFFLKFLVSRRSRWTFGFTSVCPHVRTCPFSRKIRALEFSDFLY